MPVCTSESLARLWVESSPPPSPPRPFIRSSSSTFTLLDRRYLAPSPPPPDPEHTFLTRLIGWYPSFVLHFLKNLIATIVYLSWSQFLLIGPTLWLSVCLWIFWKCVQLPVNLIKWLLRLVFTSPNERSRKKRTVLISGGSTIQTLHLARNFYEAGLRVVVFEIEGLFGLTRFSTAVSKFYTVPKPHGDRAEDYVAAIKDIAIKEKAGYYIPVSTTSTAYYDALVKPYLELQGCTCFCPGLKEICILDDAYELLRRCKAEGMATPLYYPVLCKEEVYQLYDDDTLRSGRHIMMNIGPLGCRERMKILLPPVKREFKAPHYISPQRPWVILRDYPGDHFVTCTTVKESQVVANVTCRVENSRGNLVPVENTQIEIWLQQFFTKLRFLRPISGHMSFRFVEVSPGGNIVPMGCRVGVSLAYICYTNIHPRLVCKPCRHFTRQASRPLVSLTPRYWMHEAFIDTLTHPSVESVSRFLGTVLDKREALFTYWDPLPYCAYYHIQVPFNHVLRFVQGHNGVTGLQSPILASTQ